jgi:hypothetical protein
MRRAGHCGRADLERLDAERASVIDVNIAHGGLGMSSDPAIRARSDGAVSFGKVL